MDRGRSLSVENSVYLFNMEEVWKDIEGYEGKYQVSNFGRVKHLPYMLKNISGNHFIKEKICKQHLMNQGYYIVDLYSNNTRKTVLVHRLVAKAFISNPYNYRCVNHLDNNKLNNRVDNLEWCTYSHNIKWSYDTNDRRSKMNWKKGGEHHLAKPIIMIDRNNNIVQKFKSIMDAERQIGIRNNCIVMCLKGKYKTAGGYVWIYDK